MPGFVTVFFLFSVQQLGFCRSNFWYERPSKLSVLGNLYDQQCHREKSPGQAESYLIVHIYHSNQYASL